MLFKHFKFYKTTQQTHYNETSAGLVYWQKESCRKDRALTEAASAGDNSLSSWHWAQANGLLSVHRWMIQEFSKQNESSWKQKQESWWIWQKKNHVINSFLFWSFELRTKKLKSIDWDCKGDWKSQDQNDCVTLSPQKWGEWTLGQSWKEDDSRDCQGWSYFSHMQLHGHVLYMCRELGISTVDVLLGKI